MVSSEFLSPMANGYFLLANIFNAVKIEKIVVPEVVQRGSNVTLYFQYSVPDDHFTVMWLYNNISVYMWRPHSVPSVTGVLEGRLDLSYKISKTKYEHHALRILEVDPALSGEYTCVLSHNGVETRQTKSMLIYSSEEEFDLSIREQLHHGIIDVTCAAGGLYPQPDMIIEYNNEPISQQSQRVWHRSNLYNAEGKAQLMLAKDAQCKQTSEVTCRLYLAQVDYTAIKKRYLKLGHNCSSASRWKPTVLCTVLTIKFLFILSY